MALRFLDNISLEGNQLQNSLLQVLASNPTPLGEGQIIYNSTTNSINYYDGTSWIALNDVGDISEVIAGTALNGGGTSGAVTINHDDYGTAGTYSYPTSVTTNAQGHVTSITAGPAPGTMNSFTVAGDTGTNQIISEGNTLTLVGSTGIATVGAATDQILISLALSELPANTDTLVKGTDTIVGLWNSNTSQGTKVVEDIPVSSWGTAIDDINMGSNKIVSVSNPTSAQDAATKNYVDTTFAGSGALIFQGGYDASTSGPNGSALKGWTYAVTVAGNGGGYWSTPLEVGDLIIAEQDNPASDADWTDVQNNVDVATDTILGIAKFPSSGGLAVSAGAVSLATSGVTAGTYGDANSVSQITVDNKGIVTSASDVDIAITSSQVTNFDSSVDIIINSTKYKTSFGDAAATSFIINHSLNTRDVIVQVYSNIAPYDTVQCTVERTTTNSLTLSTSQPPALNEFRVLVQSM
jgi:hypothetical protein